MGNEISARLTREEMIDSIRGVLHKLYLEDVEFIYNMAKRLAEKSGR